ncbi:MAG: Intermembrane phospholipid transport system permease protein MlaE [Chlamydiales bacterium]|nr:Intermembrane phospholipid transport system permease protein MlaE [Chlamydiales bacterium]MCH9636149.1 Intermembrane phospholipid transport system permease protein MlaE [Chlamydiales bacterium]MCH9703260.1 ABC transporter permease [Chlamydiota bacterium]
MGYYIGILYNSFASVGMWCILFLQTVWVTIKRPPSWTLILDKFYNVGVLSLPVVAITGFSTGLVLAAQAFYELGDKGLSSAIGLLVGKGMLTEIGPVLTSFMVTGRVGSAITATIGTMKVTEQIDALHSMSVNPLRYLFAPQIIACCIMLPLLTIFSAVLGIFGGYLISVFVFHMTPEAYFDPMPMNITYFDFWEGIVKAFVFGLLISTIACYKGIQAKGGAAGVGKATTNSVVICYSYILLMNFVMTVGLNSFHIFLQEHWGLP